MSSSRNHTKIDLRQHHVKEDCKHISKTSFDQFELDILQITRLFFLSFHHPASYAWVNAFSLAEQRFIRPYGATIANAVLTAINAVCGARGSGLRYHDPQCSICQEYVTPEEIIFIGILHQLRKGNRQLARTMAMQLCEAIDGSRTIEAMDQLVKESANYHSGRINEDTFVNPNRMSMH